MHWLDHTFRFYLSLSLFTVLFVFAWFLFTLYMFVRFHNKIISSWTNGCYVEIFQPDKFRNELPMRTLCSNIHIHLRAADCTTRPCCKIPVGLHKAKMFLSITSHNLTRKRNIPISTRHGSIGLQLAAQRSWNDNRNLLQYCRHAHKAFLK